MELYEVVFNQASIYDMLFINIKSVLEFPTIKELKENKPHLYEQWESIAKYKYHMDTTNVPGEEAGALVLQDVYLKYAPFYAEYSKIVGITYAKVYSEDNKLKRKINSIVLDSEKQIIENFQAILHQISSAGLNSTPPSLPNFCGHNIVNYDIPLFIKRFLNYRNDLNIKFIPVVLKNHLQSKPWDTNVIDTVNIWKFKGKEYPSLNLITEFMGLKKTTELLTMTELSKYYWDNIKEKPEETLEFIKLQSATQANLTIQLINELRTL